MAAKKFDITIEQGDTFSIIITVTEAGVAKDLTSFTMAALLKDKPGGATVATFAVTIEGAAVDGKIRWELTATLTRALTTGGEYDLRILSPTGVATRLLQGRAKLVKEITTTL